MTKIFENTKEIENIKSHYKKICDVLNENTQKILSYDPSLNDKLFILYTLNFNRFSHEIYHLLGKMIKKESKFFTPEMVTQYYYQTAHRLIYNECVRNGNVFQETKHYELKENNLKQLYGIKDIDNLLKMLDYDSEKHLFSINGEELQKEIDKHIFYTSNKKQDSIIKKINEFNKISNELWECGLCAYRYINPFKDITEISMSEELATDILMIE